MSFKILPFNVPTILTQEEIDLQQIEEGGSWQPCYSDSIFKIVKIAEETIHRSALYQVTRLLAIEEEYPLGKSVYVSFETVVSLQIDKSTGRSLRPEFSGYVFETMLRGDCSGYIVKRIR